MGEREGREAAVLRRSIEQERRRTAVHVLVERGVSPRQAMDLAGVTDPSERMGTHLSCVGLILRRATVAR